MILITKAESEVVRAQYPKLTIPRTCKQKSKRHRYYLVEDENVLRLITSTNSRAAELVAEIDAQKKNARGRRKNFSSREVEMNG